MSVNKWIGIGNVGQDPEVRYLEGGNTVAKFSLATTESYKNKQGEQVKGAQWHNLVMWNRLAELAEKYIKKGSKLYVEGKVTYRSWEDSSGVKKYMTDIVATSVQFLDGKKQQNEHHPNDTKEDSELPEQDKIELEEDDLPF